MYVPLVFIGLMSPQPTNTSSSPAGKGSQRLLISTSLDQPNIMVRCFPYKLTVRRNEYCCHCIRSIPSRHLSSRLAEARHLSTLYSSDRRALWNRRSPQPCDRLNRGLYASQTSHIQIGRHCE